MERETNVGGLIVQMKYFAISYMFIYFDVENHFCLICLNIL